MVGGLVGRWGVHLDGVRVWSEMRGPPWRASSFSTVYLSMCAPGSMNRLFSDLLRLFEGVILEVFGTIWGCLGEIRGENLR